MDQVKKWKLEMFFSSVMRVMVSPIAIAIINALIVVVIALALCDLVEALSAHVLLGEPMDTTLGIGVILIGWGVALEERQSLRELFHLAGGADEERQMAIDHDCHGVGVGALLLGLFSEVAIECIKLPNRVVNTSGIEPYVLGLAVAMLVLCAGILGIHILRLGRFAMAAGRWPEGGALKAPTIQH